MANPDRPNGLTPVGVIGGSPWNARVRRIAAADRSSDTTNNHGDIYIGDPIALSSGKAVPADSAATILGVCVGVGKSNASVNPASSPFNPADLTQRYAPLTDATGWDIFYVPADNVVFEVQSASDLDLAVGSAADINLVAATAHGSRTTGMSNVELTTDSDSDVKVVGIPDYPDNDSTLANTRYHVIFPLTAFEQ